MGDNVWKLSTWNEADHPRVPKGEKNAGQFREKGVWLTFKGERFWMGMEGEKYDSSQPREPAGGPGGGRWSSGGATQGQIAPERDTVEGVSVMRAKNLPERQHEDFRRALGVIPEDVRENIRSIFILPSTSDLRLEPGEPLKAAHTYPTHYETERTGPGVFDFTSKYTGSAIEIAGPAYWNKTLWHEAGHVHHQMRGLQTGIHMSSLQAEQYATAYESWITAGAHGKFKPPLEIGQ